MSESPDEATTEPDGTTNESEHGTTEPDETTNESDQTTTEPDEPTNESDEAPIEPAGTNDEPDGDVTEEHDLTEAEAVLQEFQESVEAYREGDWKNEPEVAALTDGVPAAGQEVMAYMTAAFEEGAYEEVETVWENFHQDFAIARMFYAFGCYLADVNPEREFNRHMDAGDGEFYGAAGDGTIEDDIAAINDRFEMFDVDGDLFDETDRS